MFSISSVLSVLGFTTWSFALSVHVIAAIRAKFYLYRWQRNRTVNGTTIIETSGDETVDTVGVSIIKTMTGGTSNFNALKNLECLFELNYPKFEILVCLPDDKEADLITSIQAMMEKHSSVKAHLFTNALQVGVNPKVNNMMQCYSNAVHDWVWVCDSSIFVNKYTLSELTSHCGPDVGIIHQLPYINTRPGFASCLEKVYFGTQHARWYIFFNLLRQCCTNGMSSLLNKTSLDEVGGLEKFSGYIAEDYFIGRSYFDRGLKIVLSTEPAIQNPDASTVTQFVNRITRWTKLRLTMLPTSILEPLIECFALGIIGAFSVSHLFGVPAIYVYLFHVGFWFSMDQLLMYIIEGTCSSLPPFSWRSVAWLYRELITYWVFAKAVWNRKIKWRLGTFDIKYGGRADFVAAEPKLA